MSIRLIFKYVSCVSEVLHVLSVLMNVRLRLNVHSAKYFDLVFVDCARASARPFVSFVFILLQFASCEDLRLSVFLLLIAFT